MWDIDREENFILNLEGGVGYSAGDMLTCLSYSNQKGRTGWGGLLEKNTMMYFLLYFFT